MVWLSDGEKRLRIWLLVLIQCTNVTGRTNGLTDGQTAHDGIGLRIALCGKNRTLYFGFCHFRIV